jgi:hypothetical protein
VVVCVARRARALLKDPEQSRRRRTCVHAAGSDDRAAERCNAKPRLRQSPRTYLRALSHATRSAAGRWFYVHCDRTP